MSARRKDESFYGNAVHRMLTVHYDMIVHIARARQLPSVLLCIKTFAVQNIVTVYQIII